MKQHGVQKRKEHRLWLLQEGRVHGCHWWDFLSQLEATPAEGTPPLGLMEGRKEGRTGRLKHKSC